MTADAILALCGLLLNMLTQTRAWCLWLHLGSESSNGVWLKVRKVPWAGFQCSDVRLPWVQCLCSFLHELSTRTASGKDTDMRQTSKKRELDFVLRKLVFNRSGSPMPLCVSPFSRHDLNVCKHAVEVSIDYCSSCMNALQSYSLLTWC